MSETPWYEIPTRKDEDSGVPYLKYALGGNITVVYSGNCAYVTFGDEQGANAILGFADVRRLTDAEVKSLSQNLPFAFISRKEEAEEESGFIGLGDVISWITRRLGIHECEGCRRRKKWLNRVPVWPRRA